MEYPDLQRHVLEEFAAFPPGLDFRRGEGFNFFHRTDEDREKRRLKLRAWRANNPEKLKAQQERARPKKLVSLAAWKRANPEKVAQHQRDYREKKRLAALGTAT